MKPLPSSMLLFGMLGFIISGFLTYSGLIDASWGFAFTLVFLIIFISSIVSITPDDEEVEDNKVEDKTEDLIDPVLPSPPQFAIPMKVPSRKLPLRKVPPRQNVKTGTNNPAKKIKKESSIRKSSIRISKKTGNKSTRNK